MQVQKARHGYKLVKSLFGKYQEIPEDWNFNKLEGCCDILDSRRIPLNSDERKKIQGDVPYYGANGVLDHVNKHIFDENLVLLAEDGGYFDEYQTRPIAQYVTGKIWVNNHAHVLKNRIGYDLKFIYYSLVHKNIVPWINGSTRSKLNQSELREIKIIMPSLENEQQKIASILSNVDSLINQTQKEIEQTQRLKKGLMQKLLTKGIGHSKFKKVKWLFGKEIKIPEKWERKSVKDLFNLKTGGTPSRTKPEYFTGNIPWVTSTDLNRGIIYNTLEKITQEAMEKSRLKIFPKGTFVIATYGLEAAGTRGKCGILAFGGTMNQACMAFLPIGKMLTDFLFHFYKEYGERIAFNFAQGTKQQNLYPDTVKEIPIICPPLTEQQKIASILSDVDLQVSELESKKTKLETIKKGLMQKLLTGQIRVKV